MNKNTPQTLIVVILFVMITAWLPGCTSAVEEETHLPVTIPPTKPSLMTPTPEHTTTATASPTKNPTATRPPTRTPLPRQTDLPTIPPGDINAILDALYKRCQLPCLGGIIPGKTSQYAARDLLAPLGEWYSPISPSGEWSPFASVSIQYENSTTIDIGLGFEHGLVSDISFGPPLTRPYKITRLLNEFGVPEDIQLEVLPETAELTTYYNLALLYPSQGILARFSARGTVLNSIIYVCPRNVAPELDLFPPAAYTVEAMNKEFVFRPHTYYQPISELTGIDINQFHEIFTNLDTGCIATNMKPIHP